MSGNRLVHIIGLDSSTMLTKPCPQSSSSFPNIKHATSTAGDAIDEMGGGARKLVLNLIIGFRCPNGGGRVYVITSFTIASLTRKRSVPMERDVSLVRELLTRDSRIFLICRKDARGFSEKMEEV